MLYTARTDVLFFGAGRTGPIPVRSPVPSGPFGRAPSLFGRGVPGPRPIACTIFAPGMAHFTRAHVPYRHGMGERAARSTVHIYSHLSQSSIQQYTHILGPRTLLRALASRRPRSIGAWLRAVRHTYKRNQMACYRFYRVAYELSCSHVKYYMHVPLHSKDPPACA